MRVWCTTLNHTWLCRYRVGADSMKVVFHAHNGAVLYTTPPILARTKQPQPDVGPPAPFCTDTTCPHTNRPAPEKKEIEDQRYDGEDFCSPNGNEAFMFSWPTSTYNISDPFSAVSGEVDPNSLDGIQFAGANAPSADKTTLNGAPVLWTKYQSGATQYMIVSANRQRHVCVGGCTGRPFQSPCRWT